jgi:hypothetical protein
MPDIKDSLYDQLNASGTVAKQRVVETFTGDALDTDRWTTLNIVGSSTALMSDSVDGGLVMTTGTSINDGIRMGFNNKRQYSHTGAVGLFVVRKNSATINDTRFGIANNAGTYNNDCTLCVFHQSANIYLTTYPAGGYEGGTDTGIDSDTNYHLAKIENLSSSAELSIDGSAVLATRTTNLATASGQPACKLQTSSATSQSSNITYVECYNT